jgi:hypothetical protein
MSGTVAISRLALAFDLLNGSDWNVPGTPITLFYDPLWTLPFLRRNEAAVAVVSPEWTS